MSPITTRSSGFIEAGSAGKSGSGWISRLVTRIVESRRLQAEEAAARFISGNGGRLTDDLERRIGETSF